MVKKQSCLFTFFLLLLLFSCSPALKPEKEKTLPLKPSQVTPNQINKEEDLRARVTEYWTAKRKGLETVEKLYEKEFTEKGNFIDSELTRKNIKEHYLLPVRITLGSELVDFEITNLVFSPDGQEALVSVEYFFNLFSEARDLPRKALIIEPWLLVDKVWCRKVVK